MSTDSKLDTLFDQNEYICNDLADIKKAVRKGAFYDKVCSTFGGIVGGVITVVSVFVGRNILN
jgi:hypothetical protein